MCIFQSLPLWPFLSLGRTIRILFLTETDISFFFLINFIGVFVAVQLHPTLCTPIDCSMPGFPVLHHLLELAQTPVH